MIQINKATEKEIAKFNKKMWRYVDNEHYGRPVKWVEKDLIFKAVDRGKVVGSIKARYEVGVIYVRNLIIAKDRRGEGIGRKLLEKVEKVGKRLGGHKMFLFTMEKWKASKFYKKLGYKKTGDLPKHFLKRNFVIYSKLI